MIGLANTIQLNILIQLLQLTTIYVPRNAVMADSTMEISLVMMAIQLI